MPIYPLTGFHFSVGFENFTKIQNDIAFQEVTGLSVTIDVDSNTYAEGGENRFIHRLPGRTKYEDIILKRGKALNSEITDWCIDTIENFNYRPTNLLISLLNEDHSTILSWYVVNAIPVKYDISGMNAEQSEVLIESITLRYEYYKMRGQNGSGSDNSPPVISASVSISFP